MPQSHTWRIKKQYFNQLFDGSKKLEIRVGYSHIKKVKSGDTISFENYEKNKFDVVRIGIYQSFSEMLANEPLKDVLPGYSKEGALKALEQIYPKEKERLGVYVFELKNEKDRPIKRILIASTLAKKKRDLFSKVVAEAYVLTDWINKDYPNHFDHYWSKYVPGIFLGERDVVVCYVDNKIAGVSIIKKDEQESKLSTLFVSESFRGMGICTDLLEASFKILGTTKPLVSIADYKLPMLKNVIDKYKWELVQSLDNGHYNNHSNELVYNGNII